MFDFELQPGDRFEGIAPELALIRGNVKVAWVDADEGWCGEYDETDPDDEKLLRFDVLVRESQDGDWEPVRNGSFCTRFPVETTEEQQKAALVAIMNAVYDAAAAGESIKRAAEEMSWICPEDVEGGGVRV